MKKHIKYFLAVLLVISTLLSSVSCSGLFSGISSDKSDKDAEKLPHNGHYLVDLYEPYDATRDKYDPSRFSSYVTVRDEVTMAYEVFHKAIRFEEAPNDGEDLYFDYDIGAKYENISFFYGMDMSTPWQAENVAFQIIDPDTREIIWEDLFEVGDIPRFATVNIKGRQRIRLECLNKHAGDFCMADITLWEGESQAKDRTYEKITKPTMLEDNYKFYYTRDTFTLATSYPVRNFGKSSKPLSIMGKKFEHAALLSFGGTFFNPEMGDMLFMNLRGQFKQIRFTWGLSDYQPNSVSDGFKGYLSIYADGKCVLDEYVCTTETPSTVITLDVDYARQLQFVTRSNTSYNAEFCLADLQGGEKLGDVTETNNDMYKPVPLVRTYPPYFLSSSTMARAKIFDYSSKYEYFSMGGVKYCEGIVLQPVWNMLSNSDNPAYAITDLKGEHKYITFSMGHVDNSPYKKAMVEIYLNDEDEPSYTYTIGDTELPREYTIDVNYCRTIKFLCHSVTENNLPTVGIANIVAYPDEVVENDIFPPYYKEYPESCEMLDYFVPFGYSVAELEKPYYTDGIEDDGMYFTDIDGVQHKKGLLFCTRTGIDWDKVGWVGFIGTALAGWAATYAAADSETGGMIKCTNSFYLFNVDGQYDTLTFKTAKVTGFSTEDMPTYRDPSDPEAAEYMQDIKIYGDSDESSIYSCRLIDGEVQEHTVDISGMERIVFCIPNNEHLVSEVYSAFDIQLSKNTD